MRAGCRRRYGCVMRTKSFRVVALPTAVAEEARRRANAGAVDHEISTVDSPQSAPCRHCLSWAEPGERMILFPFASIPTNRPYAECGPIFIHAEACERYDANEFPPEFRSGRVLRAYNEQDEIIAAELPSDSPEEAAARLLQDPQVRFLQVRSATYGCYTFKLERA